MNNGDRIHLAIRGAIADYDFPEVDFPGGVRTTSVSTVKAQTAIVRPGTAAFVEPRSKRTRFRTRDNWTWNAEVAFSCQVSLEEFEDSLGDSPIVLPRDPGNGLPDQVTIFLEEATYSHPPRSEPSSGSRAVFRFVAQISPR